MLFVLKKKKKRIIKLGMAFWLFFAMGTGAIFLLPDFALAQSGDVAGLNVVDQTIELKATDPRIIIARIIQIALGFLGIIAVSLIIYGGWIYMMSEGNEEKITKAKNILKNALIGLIIILSAFGIVSFILNSLLGDSSSGGRGPRAPGTPVFRGGFGAVGACSVESVFPEDMVKDVPRNTAIIITFKEEIDPATVCENPIDNGVGLTTCRGSQIKKDGSKPHVRIYMLDQADYCSENDQTNCYDAKVYSNDNKTFVFSPDNYLGSDSGYYWYEVYATNNIQLKNTGEGVFSRCRSDFLSWRFEVSDKLDLTPPKVRSVFPPPDNEADDFIDTGVAIAATGAIAVNSVPQTRISASYGNLTKTEDSPDLNISGTYNCAQDGTLNLSIDSFGNNFVASSIRVLGVVSSQPISGNQATVCGLTFSAEEELAPGNSWMLPVTAAKSPDQLNVGGTLYTFVASSPGNNEIEIGANENQTASNIADALNSRSDIEVVVNNNQVNIEARTAGSSGNNITLASDSPALSITGTSNQKLSGGQNQEIRVDIKYRKDQPRNATIQINFNEAMLPLTISGTSESVQDYIRVINIDAGEILTGRFEISNMYKTIEFIPDNECGVNACGGRVYCLPGNSNIKVEIKAAALTSCSSNPDCVARMPYSVCSTGGVCQTADGINYPQGDLSTLNGALDAAFNSLDGNRDDNAQGSISYYNENKLYGVCDDGKICTGIVPQGSFQSQINCSSGICSGAENIIDMQNSGDNYQWSFFISDELDLTAPKITVTSPVSLDSGVNLSEPIELQFDKLLKSSSLRTGGKFVINERDGSQVPHKYVNLWGYANEPLGYWITKEDRDDPPDNNPNYTFVYINHSMFSDAAMYRAQAGSGIEDIYQNCFLPSEGPGCAGLDKSSPSCCDGVFTSSLDASGNCP